MTTIVRIFDLKIGDTVIINNERALITDRISNNKEPSLMIKGKIESSGKILIHEVGYNSKAIYNKIV